MPCNWSSWRRRYHITSDQLSFLRVLSERLFHKLQSNPFSSPMAIKSVAVIGAGPSGIIALDALVREKSFDVIKVFDRRYEVGGSWVFTGDEPEDLPSISKLNSKSVNEVDEIPGSLPAHVEKGKAQRHMDNAIYSYLETNVVASVMQFSEEPFPSEISQRTIDRYGVTSPFRPYKVVQRWIQSLYKNKGYDDHIKLNTSVERLEKSSSTNTWKLVLREFRENEDYVWSESFDAVVVATGHYSVPYVPNIPGLQEFKERDDTSVIHSKAFRTPSTFQDKKTIVVGGSVSAMDLIRDLVGVTKSPIISSRTKDSGPHLYFGTEAFEHHSIDRRTRITKIDPQSRTVYFDDGTSVDDIDSIVFGTGFQYSYPFIQGVEGLGRGVPYLYQNIFNPTDTSLSFVGANLAGLTFKVFEWQAVLVARHFSGRAILPDEKDRLDWVTSRLDERGEGVKFVTIFPEFEEYFEELRKLAGSDGPGRKLPAFDKKWVESFWEGHLKRRQYWADVNTRDATATKVKYMHL